MVTLVEVVRLVFRKCLFGCMLIDCSVVIECCVGFVLSFFDGLM